jgi:hypothetical protein
VATKAKATKIIIGVQEVVIRTAMDVGVVEVEVDAGRVRVVALQERKILLLMNWQASRYVALNYVNQGPIYNLEAKVDHLLKIPIVYEWKVDINASHLIQK